MSILQTGATNMKTCTQSLLTLETQTMLKCYCTSYTVLEGKIGRTLLKVWISLTAVEKLGLNWESLFFLFCNPLIERLGLHSSPSGVASNLATGADKRKLRMVGPLYFHRWLKCWILYHKVSRHPWMKDFGKISD